MALNDGSAGRTHYSCSDYNRLLNFHKLPDYENSNLESVVTAVHEVGGLLEVAEQALKKTSLIEKTSRNTIWNGDETLIALPAYRLDTNLGSLGFKHLGEFAQYIAQMLAAAAPDQRRSRDRSLSKPANRQEYYFTMTASNCIQSMLDVLLIPEALHTMVLLKAVEFHDSTTAQSQLDTDVKSVFRWGENVSSRVGSARSSLHFGQWNLAASVRLLRAAYVSRASVCNRQTILHHPRLFLYSSNAEPIPYPAELRRRCFHTSSIQLLDWLQKRSWSEIRVKVLLTVGTLLAAELTERVFDYTLCAEEVPLRPSVLQTDKFEQPGNNERSWQVWGERSKEVYWCGGRDPLRDVVYVRPKHSVASGSEAQND